MRAPLWTDAGSNQTWPFVLESTQIRSRGSAASLVSGTLVAVPSGFAVVLAMTGGSTNALVGVAIAAALLPPIVNAVTTRRGSKNTRSSGAHIPLV